MRPRFGTLKWGDRSEGVMTRMERLHFVRNFAYLATREVTDTLRSKLGLLKAVDLDLADLAPPDTRMVRDVEEYAIATHTPDLLAHGYRTYYFGAMLGAWHKYKYDPETYFAAAILHDVGLTESRLAPLTQCCFAVSGGRQAKGFLLDKQHPPAQAQIVGDAISAHLSLHLPVRQYGEVAALVTKGAVCDLFGFERRRLSDKSKSELLHAHPAGDLKTALLSEEPMAPGSRLDFGRNLSGGLPERLWIQDIE
ncbi:MAG: phosphohydrolase [Bradyrhizobium sp.]|nr:phosphohydrolase [Bradyrhizobium sp.]